MKRYKDLNLAVIRDELGLDFAHWTYQRGMCSCCYGPLDLPRLYWRKDLRQKTDEELEEMDYTYVLFKNASNGSGCVKRNNIIDDYTCISWYCPQAMIEKFCYLLARQLDEDYMILVPENNLVCVNIRTKKMFARGKELAMDSLDEYKAVIICGDRDVTVFKEEFDQWADEMIGEKETLSCR